MLHQATARETVRDERRLLEVPLASFNAQLAKALPRLIEFVCSQELRAHPVWGQVIPYHVPAYGTGRSLGHCIRPDVLLTANGPKICELDFVPSGRGYLLSGLTMSHQSAVLRVFADWYRKMGVSRIAYATASTTVCAHETALFASRLRAHSNLDIRAANIDVLAGKDLDGVCVDRLFYRSEMSTPGSLADHAVITAEPWLDSKAIMAMVHDRTLDKTLKEALGDEALEFLREVIPETRLVERIKSDADIERLADEHMRWVVKNSDVETDDAWGSRGTVIGASYRKQKFLSVLKREATRNGKNVGSHPVLQRYHQSRDFWGAWDGVVNQRYRRTTLFQSGRLPDEKTAHHATREVGARIGFYFLVVRGTGECLTTPYGDIVLRQDRLIHGASDAIGLPAVAY